MSLGTLAIRGIVGPLFIGHGAQKLWGAFGGHGLEGTGQFFETLGLRPGKRHATAAGMAELAGGVSVTLGALTPAGAALVSSTMITAIRKVHAKNGPWTTEGGWEYNAVLIAAMAMLVQTGPGRPSVDAAVLPRMRGSAWAAASLLAGAVGSALATSDRLSGEEPGPQEGQADVAGDPTPVADEDRIRFEREEAAMPAQSQRTDL